MKKELKAIALTLRSNLSLIWDTLFTSVSNEPRIWQKRDLVRISFAARFGNICWCVYNPIDGRSTQLFSKQEVRQWLEQEISAH